MKKFNKLLSYYFFQLRHSIAFFCFSIGFFIIPIITILISYFLNSKEIYYSSFIVAIVFQIYILLNILFLTIRLFNENKYNYSDIKLLGKNYYRAELFWTKFIIIAGINLIGIIIMSILSAIVLAGLNVSSQVMAAMVVSNLIGISINIFFILPILIILSVFLKRIWSPLVSLLVILIFPITSIVANVALTNPSMNNNLNVNINNQDAKITYNKIYKFNRDNKLLDSKNVYSINYNGDNVNENLDMNNNINYINPYSSFMLGNITLSTQQSIFASIASDTSTFLDNYQNYQTSLVKLTTSNFSNMSNFLTSNSNYVLTNIIGSNIFDLKANELVEKINDDLRSIYESKKYKSIIDNETQLNSISNLIFANPIWNFNSLSQVQIDLIFELLGKNVSSFFYLWFYNDIFVNNDGGLFESIAANFNPWLSSLIKKLWTEYSTYMNIIILKVNSEINDFRINVLEKKYPIHYTYNSNLMASTRDLDFFLNNIIYFENTTNIKALDNNGIYTNIDKNQFYNIFGSEINNQDAWINYLTKQNIPTSGFLEKVYKDISSIFPNLIDFKFNNSNFNLSSFQMTFDIVSTPYVQLWPIYLSIQLIMVFILLLLSWKSYKSTRLE